MNNDRIDVLFVLLAYRHGHHTNLAKGVMNNRDACAFILWKLGPMKLRDIKNILNEWRGLSTNQWNRGRALAQTYLFNSSRSGGYGCVADEPMQRGNHMCNKGWSGIVSDPNREFAPKTFFRRTYWYRIAKGTYAPSVECANRMAELGFA